MAGDDKGFSVRDNELAGFGLAGWVQPSGAIRLTSGRFIKSWPEEITFHGNTYTLEETIDGSFDEETGEMFQNAEYA